MFTLVDDLLLRTSSSRSHLSRNYEEHGRRVSITSTVYQLTDRCKAPLLTAILVW